MLAPLAVSCTVPPEQNAAGLAGETVTAGTGLTVVVIVKGAPGHEFTVEVGVTMYCTVPAVVLLGLVRV